MQTLIALITPLIFATRDPASAHASGRWTSLFRRAARDDRRRVPDFNPYQLLVAPRDDRPGR